MSTELERLIRGSLTDLASEAQPVNLAEVALRQAQRRRAAVRFGSVAGVTAAALVVTPLTFAAAQYGTQNPHPPGLGCPAARGSHVPGPSGTAWPSPLNSNPYWNGVTPVPSGGIPSNWSGQTPQASSSPVTSLLVTAYPVPSDSGGPVPSGSAYPVPSDSGGPSPSGSAYQSPLGSPYPTAPGGTGYPMSPSPADSSPLPTPTISGAGPMPSPVPSRFDSPIPAPVRSGCPR